MCAARATVFRPRPPLPPAFSTPRRLRPAAVRGCDAPPTHTHTPNLPSPSLPPVQKGRQGERQGGRQGGRQGRGEGGEERERGATLARLCVVSAALGRCGAWFGLTPPGRPRTPLAARTPAQHTTFWLRCSVAAYPFLPHPGSPGGTALRARHDPRAGACALVPLASADLAVADSPLSARRRPVGRRRAKLPAAGRPGGWVPSTPDRTYPFFRSERGSKAGVSRKNGVLSAGRPSAAASRRLSLRAAPEQRTPDNTSNNSEPSQFSPFALHSYLV